MLRLKQRMKVMTQAWIQNVATNSQDSPSEWIWLKYVLKLINGRMGRASVSLDKDQVQVLHQIPTHSLPEMNQQILMMDQYQIIEEKVAIETENRGIHALIQWIESREAQKWISMRSKTE